MLKFSKIKKMGSSPKVVRTAEELEERLRKMRAWTKGPLNKSLSWLAQVGVALFSVTYLKLFNNTKVLKKKRMKDIKPAYLLISNHLTMFDDFFIDSYLYLTFGFKNMKYFPWHAPEEKNFFLGGIITWLMKKFQCVPLTRGHGVFQPGMTRLKELLNTGHIVHIYPEGTRSRSGDIGRGQVGVGRLAYQTKVKILPVYHEGTQNLLPIGSHRLKTGNKVRMIVGKPLVLDDLYDESEGREVYQKIVDKMINALKELRKEMHDAGEGVVPIPEKATS